MDLWPSNLGTPDLWTNRIGTIFSTLPSDGQWVGIVLGVLFVLSWIYLLSAVRAMKRRTKQIGREVHEAIDRLAGPLVEQQAELVRRIGWAVSYLEQIEQKLEHPSAASMRVAEITAQNLVVRHEDRFDGGNGR